MRNRSNTKKTSNRLVSAVICVLVIGICVAVSVGSRKIKETNKEHASKIEQLKDEISKEEARGEELENYAKYINTKQFVEEMAREKLGLVYPGEIILRGERKDCADAQSFFIL